MTVDGPKPAKSRFRPRAFASFGLLWSFLVAAVSGLAMYLRPEGSVAAWTRWSFLGLDKKGWEGMHVLGVVSLAAFAVLHVVLNWKALWGYLRRTASAASGRKAEFAAATVLVLVLVAGAVARWAPLWTLMDARAAIKQGSLAVDVPPPSADAAGLSFAELCRRVPVSVEEATARLDRAGYRVDDPARTLEDLAGDFGTSPERLYRLLSGR